MPSTFSQQRDALDIIVKTLVTVRASQVRVAQTMTTDVGALAALPITYQTLLTEIDAALTGTPNDEAIKSLKAEKDLLVTEFIALRNAVEARQTAVTNAPV